MTQVKQTKTTEEINAISDNISSDTENSSTIIDTLSGQQKVAALLVALGKPAAARLLKHFTPDDLRRLSGQAHTLPNISLADFEILVRQFEDAFAEGVSFSEAGAKFDNLVQETLPEDEAALVFDPSKAPALPQESIWDIIKKLNIDILQKHLVQEHPQVISYIISRLPSEIAAKILIAQTMSVRGDLTRRRLHLRTVSPEIETLLDQVLRPILLKNNDEGDEAHHSQIAIIFNELDKEDIDEMLASLDNLNPEDIEKIKAKLFVFEDIPRLTERARLLLFDGIAADTIITALRGAEDLMKELILNSLSQRTRRMVETELSTENEAIKQEAVINARRSIAQTAIKLSEQGTINLLGEEGTS
ncbi:MULTISPECIES: flagellar motor switch protein FliG [unclassified Bartonella]|uniref:flagellar motor switch protein FliG n=1 Tax=unclassified Bartonella TaxID=2645622 RepID=UPI0009997C35|nr:MULTISPECIES: flagellar motor switch protein FliG [unclassified Bartonella]AQX27718.1 flagellar motor switch protein FliG [Bartonella sp. JB15]AQX29000.1 flagellar motor switch protein FliG [Bartonella sp. JB63]